MTDARMPSRWLTDPTLDGLSDQAWRTYAASLMWSNGEGTDGAIPLRALRFLHPDGLPEYIEAELIGCGRWMYADNNPLDGYQVVDWSETQSLAADVAAQRARKAEWIRNKRAEQKDSTMPVDDPVDVYKNVDVDDHVDPDVDVVSIKDKDKDKALSSELKLAGTDARESETHCYGCQRAVAFGSDCSEHGEAIA